MHYKMQIFHNFRRGFIVTRHLGGWLARWLIISYFLFFVRNRKPKPVTPALMRLFKSRTSSQIPRLDKISPQKRDYRNFIQTTKEGENHCQEYQVWGKSMQWGARNATIGERHHSYNKLWVFFRKSSKLSQRSTINEKVLQRRLTWMRDMRLLERSSSVD